MEGGRVDGWWMYPSCSDQTTQVDEKNIKLWIRSLHLCALSDWLIWTQVIEYLWFSLFVKWQSVTICPTYITPNVQLKENKSYIATDLQICQVLQFILPTLPSSPTTTPLTNHWWTAYNVPGTVLGPEDRLNFIADLEKFLVHMGFSCFH